MASQLFRGLAHLRRCSVVHLDLKLANVLLSGGKAVIGDYGTAVEAGKAMASNNIVGTCCFHSPEAAMSATSFASAADSFSADKVLMSHLS